MSARPDLISLLAPVALGLPQDDLPSITAMEIDLARRNRLIPLLRRAGQSGISDAVAELDLDAAHAAVLNEASLLDAARVLRADDREFLVLKGVATAHLDYPAPELRQFGDVDILVRTTEHAGVIELLGSSGWRRTAASPTAHAGSVHAVPMRGSLGPDIDVHQRLGPRAIGLLLDPDRFFGRSIDFELYGTQLRALSREHRLIHSAVHYRSSSGQYRRLSGLIDVGVIATRFPDVAEATIAEANELGVRWFVEASLNEFYRRSTLAVPDEWARALATPQTRRLRLVEAAYRHEQRRPMLEEAAFLQQLRRPRLQFEHLSGYLRPGQDYQHRYGRSRGRDQLRYLFSRVRATRRANDRHDGPDSATP